MKNIRFLAAVLMTISGILHIISYFLYPDYSASVGVLMYGIFYLIIGYLLLFSSSLYPLVLGIILPLTGFVLSIIKFGVPDLFSLSALFKAFSLLTIICCIYLLAKKKRKMKGTGNSAGTIKI
jgi:prepilin signal peptidase PulO-like enzyme (type II secretory pathway)